MAKTLEFPKKYNLQETESKWQKSWEENNIYQWEQDQPRDNTYVIDTPPPTVSGMLHMGHVFSYTQADFVARYQRMKGKTVYYPMGFDDNGLPTERLVEKVKKVKGAQISRADFVEMCTDVSENARADFRDLFESIALSIDWSQEYHTISNHTRAISQMSFLDLYEKDLLARKYEPCYWCPVDQTALSQADIEDKEMPSQMNNINFALEDGKPFTIATTRPELIAACVAIFVHPEDERYKHLIGQNAITALFKVKVPILADETVEKDKGTGIVMCCSFGDMTDVLWWKQHKLKSRVILNKYGKISDFLNEESPEFNEELSLDIKENSDFSSFTKYYQEILRKNVKQAREIMLSLLDEANLLLEQTPLTHPVKCAERSGAPIEIMLTKQWFVKILEQKDNLLAQAAKANWYPHHMKIRIDQWIKGLSYDWCISRQRFFGVPFPIWYVSEENSEEVSVITATKEELPIDPLFALPKGYELIEKISEGEFLAKKDGKNYQISAEKDVMDTWATSSVSPQISSSAINKNYALDYNKHQKLFPADLRPQAHEIIRSWAFYTIVKSYYHENSLPWKNLMISGWCLASDKTKMSKSKGNVVTPVNLINEKGSDVVRYWAANSHLGADTAYSEDVLSIGKKLTNKLWNAAKFAAIHLEHVENPDLAKNIADGTIFCTTDLWILNRLDQTIKKAEQEFDKYEYAKALNHVDDFFWKDFCDNYLEISKTRAYGSKENISLLLEQTDQKISAGKLSAAHTIYHILDNLLKLYAPFIPHITDELYQIIFPTQHEQIKSIHARGNWPKLDGLVQNKASADMETALEIIDIIRKNKSDNNFSLKKEINKLTINQGDKNISNFSENLLNDIIFVGNIKQIKFKNSSEFSLELAYE